MKHQNLQLSGIYMKVIKHVSWKKIITFFSVPDFDFPYCDFLYQGSFILYEELR